MTRGRPSQRPAGIDPVDIVPDLGDENAVPTTVPVASEQPVVSPVPPIAPEQFTVSPVAAVTVAEPTKAAVRRLRGQQVGEAYRVARLRISLPVSRDEDGEFPETVILGDGREVKVENEHVILSAGTPVAATSQKELENFRFLASIGFLTVDQGAI